jgi:hypothetical protein
MSRRLSEPALATALGALASTLVLLALAPTAAASYDPLASGTTKLSLDPSFQHLLASHSVKLLAAAPASRHGATYALPISGGALDPTAGKGEIDSEGTLLFQRGARRVPLRHLVVKTKREPLLAKVGGGQLKLAAAAKISFARQGFGSAFAASGLRLSAKLATRLAKKLRLPGVFAAGQPLGTLRASTQPATVAVLPKGRATLTPDPTFIAKLDKLFVSLNPIAPAERAAGPIFTLPIIPGGALAPDAHSGTLRTGGSLEFLQLGAGQLFWHELWLEPATAATLAEVDLEPSPTFPGKLGQLPILSLAPGAASADPKARTISVAAAPLSLSAASATHFNHAFAGGKETFQAGEALGTVSFSAQTQ